jgi:hypothetical protein
MFENLGIYNSQAESEYDINKHIEQGAQFKQLGQMVSSANEHTFLQESSGSEWGSLVDAYNGENSTKKRGIFEGLTMSENQVQFNNLVSQYATNYKTYISRFLNRQPEPLNVRYVKVTSNNNNDCLQISQIVVNAIINGAIVNVAPRGTVTASPTWQNETQPQKAIDGTAEARVYPDIYHSVCDQATFWELDLGRDYPVTEIIYYNRSTNSQRADGMKLQLKANNGTNYQPITLTGDLKQIFNPSIIGSSYGDSRKAAEDALLIKKNNILSAANQINKDVQQSNESRSRIHNSLYDTQANMREDLNELALQKIINQDLADNYDNTTVIGAMESSALNMNSMYYHVFVYLIIAVTLLAFVFNLMVNPNANVLNAMYVLGALFVVYMISRYFVNP